MHAKDIWRSWVCIAASLCLAAPAAAELKLATVISDNMVLQRAQPLPLWGWADPGEKITVVIGDARATAEANNRGRWEVRLPPLEVSDRPLELVVTGSSGGSRRVKNVLVGEVWLCSGSSNIYWPVKSCDRAKTEIATANFPQIRWFTVARKTADQPQSECEGSWVECSPQSVGDVSAVGFFFARELHQELKVPVGLVQSFWGGSPIEAWTSIEALRARPALKPILDCWAERRADSGQPVSDKKKSENPYRPACLYNAMIAPLAPYGIRGAITYQGLGNLVWVEHGEVLLEAMIADWRARWGQGDFPFGMIQPAPYACKDFAQWPPEAFACKGLAQLSPEAYSLQRESQLAVLQRVPHTGLALTMDIDAVDVMHFPQKQPVAHRLALWALGSVYGRAVEYQGPLYRSMSIEGSRIRIRFDHAEGGLTTRDARLPTCFAVAGDDKVFYPATAAIDGSTIVVHSDRVARPAVVRFAWGNTDVPNLINRHGLPASLFQTEGQTH